jgi:hypothetical protein
MSALDLWFEGEATDGAVAADPAARTRGDLARAARDRSRSCLTWGPGTSSAEVDDFAVASPQWQGLVRVVPADWRGASPLSPWLAGDLAAVLADVRRPLLVDPRGTEGGVLDAVHALSCAFPMLPVVVGMTPGIDPRLAARLATACPSVLLADGRAEASEVLEELALAGKVVHGSGAPWADDADSAGIVLPDEAARIAERLVAGDWRF